MDAFRSAILGMVQGLTEFLPISSSAHLILIPYFFNWDDPGLAFDVALHLGTLAAIILFFWKDWKMILKQVLKGKTPNHGVTWKTLLIGTIPGIIAGLFLKNYAESIFRNPKLIVFTLSGFAGLLWYFDKVGEKTRDSSNLSFKDALLIGCAQTLALIPGVSRSGITITAALALGLTRSASLRFSFLLSAPIIAGAGFLKLNSIILILSQGGPAATAVVVGFLTSLISGSLAIIILNFLIRKNTFFIFVAYRLCLALFILVMTFLR